MTAYLTVLYHPDQTVHVFELTKVQHQLDNEDVEDILELNGMFYDDCSWMLTNDPITITNHTVCMTA